MLIDRTKMIEDSKREVPRFKGVAHGVRMIVAEEGYRGVYRGLGPVVRHPHLARKWDERL